jgi:NADPH:quinone reductase-like Zn-dependent oxidoreductase
MRAVVFYRHGGPEVLEYREDIPVPQPAADEVLVQVRYAALNRLDDSRISSAPISAAQSPHSARA